MMHHIEELVTQHYAIQAAVSPLNGEIDLNFHVKANTGERYILKIANVHQGIEELELQNSFMNYIRSGGELRLQQVIPSIKGEAIVRIDLNGESRYMRLLTWIDGRVLADVKPHSPMLLYRLGEMCGKLSKSLVGFEHPAAHRFMKWDPSQAHWVKEHLSTFSGEQQSMATYCFSLFLKAQPLLATLRQSINHNDSNDYNILVSGTGDDVFVPGVIDFGDAVFTHTINEVAITVAYVMMHKPDPLQAALEVVKGYHQHFPLQPDELEVLFPMVATRLLISVTCSAINRQKNPENAYLQISDAPAWELLKKIVTIPPSFAHYAFREACGWEACPKNLEFRKWVSQSGLLVAFPVKRVGKERWLDLRVGSLEVGGVTNLFDSNQFHNTIATLMAESGATLAFGRYDEARAIYTTDGFRSIGNDAPQWRTVHIGLDCFAAPGTEVVAVFDGRIHSLANNAADRDYGPTIIVEHAVSDALTFYTLYGHLSLESLKQWERGQPIRKGQQLGTIGERNINGNWPPHLHFQVMLDCLGKEGDFPGVAFAHQRAIWKSICPDPWYLLTGKEMEQPAGMPKEEIVSFRQKHVGKNLSISYKDPIKMVRGYGAYLMDDTGRRYLDTVNNVAHVGHEHPRVVKAGQRQMAVLNTNTRYLHENLVAFVEELLTTMPPALNVAFLVNSGSEANELAVRLARTYTGQRDMIVSEVGYHGNTNACIEISSYKFDGKGGKGAEPHIHVVPIPDVYRGRYRSDDPTAGSKYAAHVDQAIAKMKEMGRKPAGMIFESVISCGGQVELPKNFLREAYQYVRQAGGVCIADEVQTGCGRSGDHFWAFQEHDVVPDVVTIGKPMGNGHPLAVVVTTQSIANAFKNGMEYFNTFGGNPVSCVIGLEVLKVIKEEGLQQQAKQVGAYLKAGLSSLMSEFPIIGDVRGPGLFIGFELVKDRISKEPATSEASYLANRMRDKGILMSTDGPFNNVLKIKPPMVFSQDNADFLLEAIASVLGEDAMKVKGDLEDAIRKTQ